MADEKKLFMEDAPPSYIIASDTSCKSSDMEKSTSLKKMMIVAVSVILALTIILIAILTGMYMFTKAEKDLIEYTLDLDGKMTQEVAINPNTNIVEYHVYSPSVDAWIIDDFNTNTETLMLSTTAKRRNCYVVPLNRSAAIHPSKIIDPLQPQNINVNNLPEMTLYYEASAFPIPDTSFLSLRANSICAGIPVSWLTPVCDSPIVKGTDVRRKRSVPSKVVSHVKVRQLNITQIIDNMI